MKNKKVIIALIIFLGLIFSLSFILFNVGLYTIQPIGALPEGVTLIVWRNTGEPFFNSPDAVSIKITGGVSLLSRGLALGHAPTNKIIMRLPYSEFAYLQSTGGSNFDR